MAVTIDIGDPVDIHPKNKQDVGLRLALAARAITYGEKVEWSGPSVPAGYAGRTRAARMVRPCGRTDGARATELTGFEVAGDGWKVLCSRSQDRRRIRRSFQFSGAKTGFGSLRMGRQPDLQSRQSRGTAGITFRGPGINLEQESSAYTRLFLCSFLGHQQVAHERQLLAVGRPRWNVDCSLPAEQFRQHGNLFARSPSDISRSITSLFSGWPVTSAP